MTRSDLDALAALYEKATPGPWTAGEPILGIPRFIVADCGPTGKVYPATNEVSHGTTSMDDAALIAAAVNALPSLIARVRELEQEKNEALAGMFDGLNHAGALVGRIADEAEEAARAAALAMRERCAQACDAKARQYDRFAMPGDAAVADECVAAIRALEP